MRVVDGEPVDGREVEVGGVAEVVEVAESQERAALEDEARISDGSDLGTQMCQDVVALDRLRRQTLIVRSLRDQALGDHASTTACSSEAG
jgi:hypothetical protein